MLISVTDQIKANILSELDKTDPQNCGILRAVSVPDVITKINTALEDSCVSTTDVAKIVQADTVLTARILRVANSPLMCRTPVLMLKDAINQIGLSLVRSLAVYVLLQDKFNAKHTSLNDKMHELSRKTAEVAAVMYVMCKTFTTLNADMATLIGLIHSIGAMAVINYIDEHTQADRLHELNIDEIIGDVNRQVGACILHKWGIPAPLVDVVVSIDRGGDVDTADLRTYKHIFHAASRYVDGKMDPLLATAVTDAMELYKTEVDEFMQMFG